ncbi:hypothetical protein FRX31_028005 [Thalictrum thalictroides]|uniref:Aminotransferase-like plant mobile domain-containing protein n=1 Tax=Thalictrum thalictroides TaxID=46969 RepID=A0A7J6VCD3_THATH|nr:hypothetical protein FRX31_028005 [Thalictrum thalictroides]
MSKDKDDEEGEDSSEEESESEIGGNEEGKIGEVSKDKDDEEGEDSSEEDSESESGEKEKEQNQDDSEEENTSQGEREKADEEQVENQQPARKTTPRKKSLPDVRVVAGINEDGPFPGGPQDTSILRAFYDHVALKIWLGQILDGSSAIKREEASKLLQEGLGLDKNVVEQELERCKGGDCIIQTDWIKENFKGKENVEDDGKVDCAVRAYLMYMIGCVLLPDKSGTMMSASYMRFLLDISKIHEYAWGASALAYLYRQMGFS